MTALRRRVIEDLPLQGAFARTQQACVLAVRMLAEHFHTPGSKRSRTVIPARELLF